jgi:hypothetical protein
MGAGSSGPAPLRLKRRTNLFAGVALLKKQSHRGRGLACFRLTRSIPYSPTLIWLFPCSPLIARRYTTMDAMVDKSVATERFRAALISSFAAVGLLLAMLGVYGTMAYSVAQRRFEFGVRMAFGADRGTILRSVLGHASKGLPSGG